MNELDKLRNMLDNEHIPYESFKNIYNPKEIDYNCEYYNNCGKYKRNQIIYEQYDKHNWKFDGICQLGSYGYENGLIEAYGDLIINKYNDIAVLKAEEAFDIIANDWDKMKMMELIEEEKNFNDYS